MTAWGRPVKRAQHVLWWATQAQIADRAHVVPAFGKTEKHCLKVGPTSTRLWHEFDMSSTTGPDERLVSTGHSSGPAGSRRHLQMPIRLLTDRVSARGATAHG